MIPLLCKIKGLFAGMLRSRLLIEGQRGVQATLTFFADTARTECVDIPVTLFLSNDEPDTYQVKYLELFLEREQDKKTIELLEREILALRAGGDVDTVQDELEKAESSSPMTRQKHHKTSTEK